MLFGLIGRVSLAPQLRGELSRSSERSRVIADRVAKATLGGADGFALPQPAAPPGTPLGGPVDVEQEMVSLADEQLHYEATASLLQKTYQQIRESVRGLA